MAGNSAKGVIISVGTEYDGKDLERARRDLAKLESEINAKAAKAVTGVQAQMQQYGTRISGALTSSSEGVRKAAAAAASSVDDVAAAQARLEKAGTIAEKAQAQTDLTQAIERQAAAMRDLEAAEKAAARAAHPLTKLGESMTRVGGQIQQAGRRMSQVGATMTRNVTLPILAAGAGVVVAIQKAADLGETISKVEQIFGANAAAIKTWSQTSATALGQTQQQALDAASNFALFGKAADLNGSQLVDFSTRLSGLATDLASFNNTSPEEAIQALGAGLRGEAEPLRKYGVLLDDAALKARAMQMGIYDGTGTLTQQQRVLAAYEEILAQTTTQQGDFARTSGSLANQQKILKAELGNLVTSLGQAFLPIAQEVVAVFRDQVIPQLQSAVDWFKQLSPETRRLAVILATVAAAVGPLLAVMGSMTSSFGGLFMAIGPVVSAFGAGGLGGALAAVAGPVAIAIAAIAGLVAIFVAMWRESETFRNAVTQAFNAVKAAIVPAFEQIKSAFTDNQEAIDTLKGAFKMLGDFIGTYVVPVIRDYLIVYIKSMATLWSTIINVIGKVIVAIRDLATQALRNFATVVGGLRSIAETALDVYETILNGAVNAFGWVYGLGDQLRNAQANFGTFRENVLGVFDNVQNGALAMGNTIDNATRDRTVTITVRPVNVPMSADAAERVSTGTTSSPLTDPTPVQTVTSPLTTGGGGGGSTSRKQRKAFQEWAKSLREDAAKSAAKAGLMGKGVPEALADSIVGAQGWKRVVRQLNRGGQDAIDNFVRLWKKTDAGKQLRAEARRKEREDQAAEAKARRERIKKSTQSIIDEANARLAAQRAVTKRFNDARASFMSTARDFTGLGTFQPDEGVPVTARGIMVNIQQRLGVLRRFTAALTRLRSKGLGRAALSDIFALGPESGLPYARALLSSQDSITKVKDLYGQAAAAAGEFATLGAEVTTGITAAQANRAPSVNVQAGAIQITVNGRLTPEDRKAIEAAVTKGINGVGREARASRKAGVR